MSIGNTITGALGGFAGALSSLTSTAQGAAATTTNNTIPPMAVTPAPPTQAPPPPPIPRDINPYVVVERMLVGLREREVFLSDYAEEALRASIFEALAEERQRLEQATFDAQQAAYRSALTLSKQQTMTRRYWVSDSTDGGT